MIELNKIKEFDFIKQLINLDLEIYVVGGVVRDTLMNKDVNEKIKYTGVSSSFAATISANSVVNNVIYVPQDYDVLVTCYLNTTAGKKLISQKTLSIVSTSNQDMSGGIVSIKLNEEFAAAGSLFFEISNGILDIIILKTNF